MSIEALGSLTNELKASFVVIIGRWHGGPGDIQFFEATSEGLRRIPPRIIVSGYRLQREIGNQRKEEKMAFRRVAMWSTDGAEIQRIADTFGKVFQLPQLQEASGIRGYDGVMRIWMDETHSAKLSFFTTPPERNVGPTLFIKTAKWGD